MDNFWSAPEGKKLAEARALACRNSLPAGCGIVTLSESTLKSLRTMYKTMMSKEPALVPWGDAWADTKMRGYFTLPEYSKYATLMDVVREGICLYDIESSCATDLVTYLECATLKHRASMGGASMECSLSAAQLVAVNEVVSATQSVVTAALQKDEEIAPYEVASVYLNNLAAIQPNIHFKDDFLPVHVDNPRHDGFGIVISTVALWGTADVVLIDEGDAEQTHPESRSWAFTLRPGQMYVLSGYSRNKCAHGVVVLKEGEPQSASEDSMERCTNDGRVSLNFRFGIHSPEMAYKLVDQHWDK